MIDTKLLLPLFLAARVACAAGAPPPLVRAAEVRDVTVSGSLADTLRQVGSRQRGPLWLGWDVPATASLRNACCFDRSFHHSVCRLEGENQGWGSRDDRAAGSGRLLVLARWADGKVGQTRAVSDSCALDTGGLPFVRLHGVSPTDSVALLEGLVLRPAQARSRDDDDHKALAALAYHAGPAADAALQRLAAAGRPSDEREQALFWIGQARGEEGARFLAGVARTDPTPEIREKAVFSLSQSEAPGAAHAIVEVAKGDRSPEVRGEALFWLAQSGSDEAPRVLLARLDDDPDPAVRRKAIFAISQLEGGQAVPLLVRIARERRDPEVRREALFWLGQSDDPRALDFLARLLE